MRKRERRSEREGKLKPRKWEREEKSERKGELKPRKWEREEKSEREEELKPRKWEREEKSERKGDLKEKIGRGGGTVKVRENFKKRKMREGEEEWERGRVGERKSGREGEEEWERRSGRVRERENMKIQNKKKVDDEEG
jgi:hypothetical protein